MEREKEVKRSKAQPQDTIFKHLPSIYSQSPVPTIIIHKDGKCVEYNDAVAALTGYSQEEVPDTEAWLFKLFQDKTNRKEVSKLVKKSYKRKNTGKRNNFTIIRKNGEERSIELSVYDLIYENNPTDLQVVHMLDMTGNKWEDVVLHETVERYKALFDQSLDSVFIFDLEGKIIDVNPEALNQLGYKKEELSSRNFLSLLIQNNIPKAVEVLEEVKKYGFQQKPTEYTLKCKNGEYISIEMNASLIYHDGKPIGIQSIARNITERTKTEEIEKHLIQRMDFIAQNAMELVQLSSEDNIYEAIGNKLKIITGDAIISISAFDSINNQLETKFISGIETNLDTIIQLWGKNPVGMIYHINEKQRKPLSEGKLVKIEGGLYALSFGQIPKMVCKILETMFNIGDIYGMGFACKGEIYGATTIITYKDSETLDTELIETFCNQASVALQRWVAEKSARKSEDKYQTLAESINDVIYSANSEGVLIYVSPQISRYGYCPEDVISQPILRFIVPEDREKTLSDFQRTITTGEEFPTQFRIKDKKGSIHWIEDHGKVKRDENGKIVGLTGILWDITERKNAEEALKISEAKLMKQKSVLEQKNIALREIIRQIEIEKNTIKDDITTNVNEVILPIIKKMKLKQASDEYIDLFQHLLEKLSSSFGRRITKISAKLTPREIEISTMIESGLTNKEISKLLHISRQTVEKHRKNIRKKLNITKKDINLASYLQHL